MTVLFVINSKIDLWKRRDSTSYAKRHSSVFYRSKVHSLIATKEESNYYFELKSKSVNLISLKTTYLNDRKRHLVRLAY